MNIDQIISRVSDYEAREHIHQQFLKEILILGEREALEFARFRADALADANEQAACQAKQSFHRALLTLTRRGELRSTTVTFYTKRK